MDVVVDPPFEFIPDLNGMQFGTGATFAPGSGQIGLPTLLHTVEFVFKSKLQVIVPTTFSKCYLANGIPWKIGLNILSVITVPAGVDTTVPCGEEITAVPVIDLPTKSLLTFVNGIIPISAKRPIFKIL